MEPCALGFAAFHLPELSRSFPSSLVPVGFRKPRSHDRWLTISAAVTFHRFAKHRLRAKGSRQDARWKDLIGNLTNVGSEGKSRLPPGAKQLSPVASAGSSTTFPSAPSAHRDGYATREERGPRFGLLPPPPDRPYLPHQGALQPALRSRLDGTTDIRLNGSMGTVLPKTADTVCLVPEPHVRVLRPDQRVRSTAALFDGEELTRALEKEGRWFPPDREKKAEQIHKDAQEIQKDRIRRIPKHEARKKAKARFPKGGDSLNHKTQTDSELRKNLSDNAELVSGSRNQLLERILNLNRNNYSNWTKKELGEESLRLGMPVLEKVADMVAGLKANKIHSLSDEDLYYELAYRKVDYSENRQENESKLLDALSGRINWRS